MKPDEKYMMQAKEIKETSFKFIPPVFNKNFRDNAGTDNNSPSNLYPDQTAENELYCYFNELGQLAEQNGVTQVPDLTRTFEALRCLDLDIDDFSSQDEEKNQKLDNVCRNIADKHPEIHDAFVLYKIPAPIEKIITKKLIKLSMLYSEKEV